MTWPSPLLSQAVYPTLAQLKAQEGAPLREEVRGQSMLVGGGKEE